MAERTTQQVIERMDMPDTQTTLVRLEGVSKEYHVGEVTVSALKNVSIDITQGQFVVLLGPSGSGKSTLMNMVGGLDTPTKGRIWVRENEITNMNEGELTLYRRNDVGFVFQFFNLVPSLTARENVEMVAELVGNKDKAEAALESVGLEGRLDHFPSQLSGGEQQRVSIARALAKSPSLLLADEPTGDLDFETGKMILSVMKRINEEENTTIVIVTHNTAIALMADRVLRMRSGEIIEDRTVENPISPEDLEW
jgi:putative ABC transport system ATP-binding protein